MFRKGKYNITHIEAVCPLVLTPPFHMLCVLNIPNHDYKTAPPNMDKYNPHRNPQSLSRSPWCGEQVFLNIVRVRVGTDDCSPWLCGWNGAGRACRLRVPTPGRTTPTGAECIASLTVQEYMRQSSHNDGSPDVFFMRTGGRGTGPNTHLPET